ncbi:hypothetical protein APHAL10511_004418 [Amanita phalloides]|nr:hypothetical protein APHAL10511_004418 [Amanita phalloides]
MPTSLIRRNRALIFALVTILAFITFGYGLLPESLQNPSIAQAKIAEYIGFAPSKLKVDEIYGLIHLVTSGTENYDTLTDADPAKPVELAVYAGGRRRVDWRRETKRLDTKYPIVVFSKTYCIYSKRAKKLLASYKIRPAPYIIEVDLRGDGSTIKALLSRITGRATFPNILVHGRSVGGSDELTALHESGELEKILRRAGVTVGVLDA